MKAPRRRLRLSGATLALLTALPALAQDAATTAESYCRDGYFPVDADADGLVTEAEAQDAARSAFGLIDVNDDGMIGQEEYVACRGEGYAGLDASGTGFDDVAAHDFDGDGTVSAAEYRRALQAAEGGPMVARDGQAAATPQENAARSGVVFFLLDTDTDARVTRQEWENADSLARPVEDVLQGPFGEADADASGGISEEEFIAGERMRFRRAMEAAAADGSPGGSAGGTGGAVPAPEPGVSAGVNVEETVAETRTDPPAGEVGAPVV